MSMNSKKNIISYKNNKNNNSGYTTNESKTSSSKTSSSKNNNSNNNNSKPSSSKTISSKNNNYKNSNSNNNNSKNSNSNNNNSETINSKTTNPKTTNPKTSSSKNSNSNNNNSETTTYKYNFNLTEFIGLPEKITSNNIKNIERQTMVNFSRGFNLNSIGSNLKKNNMNDQKKYLNRMKNKVKKLNLNINYYYSLLILSSQTSLGYITTNIDSKLNIFNFNDKVGNDFLSTINMDDNKNKKVNISFKEDNIFHLKDFHIYYAITEPIENGKKLLSYDITINLKADFKNNILTATAEINWVNEHQKNFMININNYINISDKYDDGNYDFFYYSFMLFKESINKENEENMFLIIDRSYNILLKNICNNKQKISKKNNNDNCKLYYKSIIDQLKLIK